MFLLQKKKNFMNGVQHSVHHPLGKKERVCVFKRGADTPKHSMFNCLKDTEPLWGDSLLISTKSQGKAKLTLEPPSCLELGTPGLGIQHHNL